MVTVAGEAPARLCLRFRGSCPPKPQTYRRLRADSDWAWRARARFLVYSGARLAKESDVILVTGATGRVGYHLMELLADAGAEATAMVRVEARGTDLPGTAGHLVASLEDPPPAS